MEEAKEEKGTEKIKDIPKEERRDIGKQATMVRKGDIKEDIKEGKEGLGTIIPFRQEVIRGSFQAQPGRTQSG